MLIQEALSTQVTPVRLSMNLLVHIKVVFTNKGLSTLVTLKRSFSNVHLHVSVEVVFMNVGLSALLTRVRPFSSVRSHVLVKIRFTNEALSAQRAGR